MEKSTPDKPVHSKEEHPNNLASTESPTYLSYISTEGQEWFNHLLTKKTKEYRNSLPSLLKDFENAVEYASYSLSKTMQLLKAQNIWLPVQSSCTKAKGPTKPKVNKQIIKLLKITLFNHTLKELEISSEDEVLRLLTNKEFIKSLLCCCIETYCLIHEVTELTFEELLRVTKVTPFNFWKQINNFALAPPPIPSILSLHLKQLENKILTTLGWQQDSPLRSFFTNSLALKEDFSFFFQRLIELVAYRTRIFCKIIGLNTAVQELVWSSIKYFLSEHTEYLFHNSVDSVLISTIFAVSKFHCEIPLQNILKRYKEIFPFNEPSLSTFEPINEFYNKNYIYLMKDCLFGNLSFRLPRIPVLSPISQLKYSPIDCFPLLPAQLSPRTQSHWDATSPSFSLENKTIVKKLDFEEALPIKKFKGLHEVLK